MRKKMLYFVAIAAIVFFGACSNEDLMPETERSFTFTASMPDDNPTTRVSLEEDGKNIVLKWEEGDQLEIAMVQDGVKVKSIARVIQGSITSNGKIAEFSPEWKDIDTDRPFDFYGVYGGGGLSTTNPTDIILTTDPGAATSLGDVESRKDVMLYFASPGVVSDDLTGGVSFKHLGSLFSITLKNTCINSVDVEYGARLTGVNNTGNVNWAYNAEVGSQFFDLETKTFLNTPTAGNFISFNSEIDNLPSGDTMIFWAWYPPLPDKNWPELQLELRDSSGSYIISTNKKPARLAPTVAGKTYNFYALWDGTVLNFTNDAFVVTP